MKYLYLLYFLGIQILCFSQSYDIERLPEYVDISIKTGNSHTKANCTIKNKTGNPLSLLIRRGQVFQLKDTMLTSFQTMILCDINHEEHSGIIFYNNEYWEVKLEKDKSISFDMTLVCITRNANPPVNKELVAVGMNYDKEDEINNLCQKSRDGIHQGIDVVLQTYYQSKSAEGTSANRNPDIAKREAFEAALLKLLKDICSDINKITQIKANWYRETPFYGKATVDLSWSRKPNTSNSIKIEITDCNANQDETTGEWKIILKANVIFDDRAAKEFESCLTKTKSTIH
jgi:hypothetical protein